MTTLKLEAQQAEGGGGGDVTKEYVDQGDSNTLSSAKQYTNTAVSGKQNTLTAGANITIVNDVISATGSTTTVAWGGITGDLSNQTDLSNALGAKQNTLTAGANITIDGNNEISATNTTYSAGTNIQINGTTISATDTTYSDFGGATTLVAGSAGLVPAPTTTDPDKFLKGDGTWSDAAANTIFYMDSSESGGTRHIYKNPDMTGAATSQEVFDANEKGQVILRISTSITPDQYSDAYLQNAYKATGDYQLLFLDEKTYRSFDTTTLSDNTFTYSSRVLQDQLNAGTNITISGATISATDTTYNNFTGTDGVSAGAAGLVPAPATTDAGKYLKADGTWATVASGGSTITMTDTDPGEGSPLAADNYIAVYGGTPFNDDYATAEIDTGTTWIDGKEIYKKTIDIAPLPNATNKTVAHNISNLDRVIKLEGYGYRSSDQGIFPLPFVSTNAASAIAISIAGANVSIVTGQDRSNVTEAYVTLYYTKALI